MTRIARRFATALLILAPAGLALAQTAPAAPPPARIRGVIQAVDANVLSVTTREGPVVKITLTDPLTVTTVKAVPLSAITPGTYVGTAATPTEEGTLTAQEVLLFPDAARGTAEGHRPWDLSANSTMTNAHVDAVVPSAAGNVLTLKYKDGSVKVVVPPGAPLVTVVPGVRDDLKPGQTVFIFAAARAADGALSTGRVTVSKDGVVPPM